MTDPGPVPEGPPPGARLTSAILWLPPWDIADFPGDPNVSGFAGLQPNRLRVWGAALEQRPPIPDGPPPPLAGCELGIDVERRAYAVRVGRRTLWVNIDAAGAVLQLGRNASSGGQ